MDVLCGITPEGSSTEETRVSISLHMQRYPSTLDDGIKNPRFVNVLVLENYTSQHYLKQVEGMINNMDFQQMGDHSKKYMRVATELPKACITFGNSTRTLRIHEAATDLCKAERRTQDVQVFAAC